MSLPILDSSTHWACPNCGATDVTTEAQPHTRMHDCAGFGGLSLPMVEESRVAGSQVVPVEREDYVGKELGLVYDEGGAPIMSAVTEYADGSNDVVVFAPVVRVEMRQ
jgi:hypothetical protein